MYHIWQAAHEPNLNAERVCLKPVILELCLISWILKILTNLADIKSQNFPEECWALCDQDIETPGVGELTQHQSKHGWTK